MSLRLRQIRALGENRYEVTFDEDGRTAERIVCRVFARKGVSGIRMEPDIVMTREPARINSQEVAAAVLAYHRRRSQGPMQPCDSRLREPADPLTVKPE